MSLIQAIIIAIIEGLTEFLPISSTAHMRFAEALLGISSTDKFTELFTIAIQLGAILAVVFVYWKKFFDPRNITFYAKLLVAVIPVLIFGKLLNEYIDKFLETPLFIAIVMILGGVVLIFIDNFFNSPTIEDEKNISYSTAFKIGMYQCLAIVFPGLSRSAASIIGGMSQKLTRKAAAEFSFFLAVPTMFAATIFKLYKYHQVQGGITTAEMGYLTLGNVIAFVVAIISIKFFIRFLTKYGFKMWGWYRIALGSIILLLIWQGVIQ